jgi:DNA uptake protein ComE-like DNA-binding protein
MNKFQKQCSGFVVSLLLVTVMAACNASAGESSATSSAPAATATQADSGAAAQDTVTATVAIGADQANSSRASSSENVTVGAKLNLNTATAEEFLNTIPDLGNRMVNEFMEYRPYVSIQQFRREIGKYVDEAQVTAYEQYVYVPIDVNEADAATLMQIAGIEQTTAAALINARPYASNAAFLDKLAELAPSVARAAVESYLEAQ